MALINPIKFIKNLFEKPQNIAPEISFSSPSILSGTVTKEGGSGFTPVSSLTRGSSGGGSSGGRTPTIPTTPITPTTTTTKPTTEKLTGKVIFTPKDESAMRISTEKGREKWFSFGTDPDKARYEYGFPILKPEEEERFKEKGLSYTGTSFGSPIEAEEFFSLGPTAVAPGTFISNVLGPTREQMEFSQSNIAERKLQVGRMKIIEEEFTKDPGSFIGIGGVETKKTDMGTEITLTEKFFEKEFSGFRKSAVMEAKELSPGFFSQSTISSGLTGFARLGAGAIEFGGTIIGNIGQYQMKEGEEFKPFSFGRTFKFETGELANLRNQPGLPTTTTFLEDPFKYVGEKAKSPQLIGEVSGGVLITGGLFKQTIRNIEQFGFKGGIVESAGMFSPLRPKPGIYSIKLTEESPFRFISRTKRFGDFQAREIVGTGEDFIISSKQLGFELPSGKVKIGPTQTELLQSGTFIGGGKIKPGVILSGTEGYTGSSLRAGDVFLSRGKVKYFDPLEGVMGGISQSFTKPKYSFFLEGKMPGKIEGFGDFFSGKSFKVFRGAGVSKDVDGMKILGFGRRTSIPGQRIEGDVIIREPSGKYRFKPTAKGWEIDLTKTTDLTSDIKILRPTPTKRTPLSKTFQEQTQVQQYTQINENMGKQLGNIQSSLTTQTPKIKTSNILATAVSQKQESALISQGTMIKQSLLPRQKQMISQIMVPRTSFKTMQKEIQASAFIQKQQEILKQRQEEKLTSIFKGVDITIPSKPRYDFGFRFSLPPVLPLIFPPLGFGEGQGRRKGKRGFAETPTLFGAYASSFGFKSPRKRTKREIGFGLPREIPYKKVSLSTTMAMGKPINFKNPFSKKRKKKLRS